MISLQYCLNTVSLETTLILTVDNAQYMATKKPRLLVILDSEIKEEFRVLCEIESRSMSSQIAYMVKNFVAQSKREGKLGDRTNNKGVAKELSK